MAFPPPRPWPGEVPVVMPTRGQSLGTSNAGGVDPNASSVRGTCRAQRGTPRRPRLRMPPKTPVATNSTMPKIGSLDSPRSGSPAAGAPGPHGRRVGRHNSPFMFVGLPRTRCLADTHRRRPHSPQAGERTASAAGGLPATPLNPAVMARGRSRSAQVAHRGPRPGWPRLVCPDPGRLSRERRNCPAPRDVPWWAFPRHDPHSTSMSSVH